MSTTYNPNWNQAPYPDAVLPDGGWPRTAGSGVEKIGSIAMGLGRGWVKPAPPLGRIVRERDYGEKCHVCGSSLKKKWFRRTDKCIHPGCSNYFNRDGDIVIGISDIRVTPLGSE